MATFKLEIEMENAAFEPAPGEELSRILNALAVRLAGMDGLADEGSIMDVNGNSVGKWEVV